MNEGLGSVSREGRMRMLSPGTGSTSVGLQHGGRLGVLGEDTEEKDTLNTLQAI